MTSYKTKKANVFFFFLSLKNSSFSVENAQGDRSCLGKVIEVITIFQKWLDDSEVIRLEMQHREQNVDGFGRDSFSCMGREMCER